MQCKKYLVHISEIYKRVSRNLHHLESSEFAPNSLRSINTSVFKAVGILARFILY